MKLRFYFFTVMIILTGCAQPLILPTQTDVTRNQLSGNTIELEFLQQAHKLYINKCGSCHFLYRPYQFTLEKWKKELPEMKDEAKLSQEEYNSIFNYIMAMQQTKPVQ